MNNCTHNLLQKVKLKKYNVCTMPPEDNFSESTFVKHPVLIGGIVAVLVLLSVGFWFYYNTQSTSQIATTESLPVPRIDFTSSLPPPATSTLPVLQKMMQTLPPPSKKMTQAKTQAQVTQSTTTQVLSSTQATQTNATIDTLQKMMQTLPPPPSN